MKDPNILYERFGIKVANFQQLDTETEGCNRNFFQKKAVFPVPDLEV